MITFFITSTTMILIILILRFLFKNQVSFLVLYPLWGIVLLRLLIPLTPLESPISIMNLLDGTIKNTEVSWKEQEKLEEKTEVLDLKKQKDLQNKQINDMSVQKGKESNQEKRQKEGEKQTNLEKNIVFEMIFRLPINQWAIIFWICGSVLFFFCIITANFIFYRNLSKNRKKVFENNMEKRKIPVYITDYVQAPCLVGVFYPVIYLPSKVYEHKENLTMILAHEEMHARHKDHIWTLFRTLFLMIYWFDPFIWIAAFYAKQDAEIACDEAVLQHCTDMQRYDYGKMLICLSRKREQENFYLLTSMESGKKNLKERVIMLTKRKKRSKKQMIGMFLIIIVLAGCGLTTKAQTEKNDMNENKTTEEQNKENEGERKNKIMNSNQQENENNKINRETIIQKFQTFIGEEINERTEWANLEGWKGKLEQLYFSVQDLGIDQIPCLLIAPPSGIIMKNNARMAMVYYYDWQKETIELLTALQTVGSGYPLEIKDGQLLVTSGQHSIRVYNWGIEGDYSKLKAKEVYGFGTYNETEEKTIYTYSEITWQVPFPVEEGETVYAKNLDSYADTIDINENFKETKAKEFSENYGYTYGAEILFYHNTEKGWKKYTNSI